MPSASLSSHATPETTCAALLAGADWAATELGAREHWPQSLRTAVDIVLGAPVPMVLLWGGRHLMIYNDGYARVCGARHPRVFGSPVAAAWPEGWDWNRAVMARCMAGETAEFIDQHMVLERNGAAEEVWFDLFYSPLRDEAGGIQGVLATVVETTQRMLTERRQQQAQRALETANAALAAERETVRLANETLRNETDFLRSLFEQAPSFMAILRGPQHVFQLYNAPYARLTGNRDLLGKPVAEALPGVAQQGFIEVLDRVYNTGEPFVGRRVRVLLPDESGAAAERILDFVYQPLRNSKGEVNGIFVEGIDITERTLTEETLRIAQEAGGIGTFEWYPESGRMEVSDQYRRIWGFTADEPVTAMRLVELVAPEDRVRVGPARLKDANPLAYTEYRIHRPDTGELRWLARQGEVVQGAGGTKRYLGISFDITERKRSEEQARDNARALAQSRDFIRLLLDSTEEAFVAFDADGNTTLANAAAARMLGYASALEPAAIDLRLALDDQGGAVLQAARDGSPLDADGVRLRRRDGSLFPAELRVRPVRQDGLLHGALAI
ncbi:MAG TPA: PAS domain S-box protein, partial [Burkholderiaceae bacterium]